MHHETMCLTVDTEHVTMLVSKLALKQLLLSSDLHGDWEGIYVCSVKLHHVLFSLLKFLVP